MPYYRTMVAGRPVVGLGAGLASCIVLFDIGELAPTRIRGRLVTIKVVAVTLGQVVAYGERNPSKGTVIENEQELVQRFACRRGLEVDGRSSYSSGSPAALASSSTGVT